MRMPTDQREEMPGKLAQAVDIGRHQCHDLGLAGEFIFIILLVLLLLRPIRVLGFGWWCSRCHILPNERLREKNGV